MQVQRSSNSGSPWVQRALIASAVVALLVAAAYVWGNRLNADTQQASTQRAADASASRYGNLPRFGGGAGGGCRGRAALKCIARRRSGASTRSRGCPRECLARRGRGQSCGQDCRQCK